MTLSSVEICTGAGGQALGLERAGFRHVRVIELDEAAIRTLEINRPEWNPTREDVRETDGTAFRGIDLLAGGVPCPPFSVAGKQLGQDDARDLFPAALALVAAARPAAVLLENVPGFAKAKFASYRAALTRRLTELGYTFVDSRILNACDFGVPQLRPRFVLVALRGNAGRRFRWPSPLVARTTVGEALGVQMAEGGWPGAYAWRSRASDVAPTLVGGSKLHGGPDLGPTRAKAAWRNLGVDAMGLANAPPDALFPGDAFPKLTVRMTSRLQGFPDEWEFWGKKTAAYRQVGNAFPPPVAEAVGHAIYSALSGVASGRMMPNRSTK